MTILVRRTALVVLSLVATTRLARATDPQSLPGQPPGPDLPAPHPLDLAALAFVAATNRLRASSLPGSPLAVELTASRAAFETAWLDSGRTARRSANQGVLGRALAQTIRSYRFQEDGNPERPNALRWADEMIGHFREEGDRRTLTDAMLEKAAIFLELSQLNHTDPSRFERISREGDRLLQDCFALAEDGQKVEVLRFWSRFYYNLSRPASGRLSERWNDNYLALADQKIDLALAIEPRMLRNLNQKARVTQRRARNSLDAPTQVWADRLWDVYHRFLPAWRAADPTFTRPDDRISPMNVLAMLALDAVTYQLAVLDDVGRSAEAQRLLVVVDDVALPVQLEAWALVRNTNLSRSYGFDTIYDLARLRALRAVLTGLLASGRQNEDLDSAAAALAEAREAATVRQLDAAKQNLAGDPVFTWLPEHARGRMLRILNGQ